MVTVSGRVMKRLLSGLSVDTAKLAKPLAATSFALRVARSCVVLSNCVGRGEPFQSTTELLKKPAPLTVILVAPLPAVKVSGFTAVRL